MMTTLVLIMALVGAALLGAAWAITRKPLFGFAAWGAILLFVLIAVSGCSVSVAGRPVISLDDGLASRTVSVAAVGAAAGAAGGAVAGDAGKGTAIGAAAGGVVGLLSGILGGSGDLFAYNRCDPAVAGPCRRFGKESQQCETFVLHCLQAADEAAAMQGRCAGGDQSACYYYGSGGLGYYGPRYYRGW